MDAADSHVQAILVTQICNCHLTIIDVRRTGTSAYTDGRTEAMYACYFEGEYFIFPIIKHNPSEMVHIRVG